MHNNNAVAVFSTLLLVAALLGACSDSSDSPATEGPPGDTTAFDATLHRTEGGIPHIVAADWASLGYGTAYAVAEDHYCEQARNILRYRGTLAESIAGARSTESRSDFFYRLLIEAGINDADIDPEFDALFEGYAAGFNRFTREHGAQVTDPACAGAEWIPEVTAEDIRRIHLTPAFLPNVDFLLLAARPPTTVADSDRAGDPPWRSAVDETLGTETAALMRAVNRDRGSNGIAIGADLSETGNGLLYTNPHLDWDNFGFRMYGLHQIIPGVTNMLGANQAQRANVGFGTNGDVAWTNTVADGLFFSFFELELVPGNPLQYIYDGTVRDIEPIEITVLNRGPEGNVLPVSHTFYRSHLGFMVGGALPWTETSAFAVRPADEGARGFQGGALAMARASNVRELKAAIDRFGNTPSINTIAADSSGEVLYGDRAPAPGYTDEQLDACATSSSGQLVRGNTSACEWTTFEDSAAPGLLGASLHPFLYRRDYVTNSNNSAWLANPNEPLTGYPRVKGDIATERSLRTRSGLALIAARQQGTDGLPGDQFNLDSLQARMLSNASMAAETLLEGTIELCRNSPPVFRISQPPVDLSEACDALAAWDGHYNLDSRGAQLFREILRAVRAQEGDGGNVPELVNVLQPFDPENPVTTPAGVDPADNDALVSAIANAVVLLRERGGLQQPLGDVQGVTLNNERIPLHGGEEFEGVLNKMGFNRLGADYNEIAGSSASWVMVTEVAGDATRVRGLTAYSQSTDPTSDNYSNLTKRFSTKDLPDIPFLLEDVEAQALSTVRLTEGSEDCADDGWQAYSGQGVTDEAGCLEYFQSIADRRLTGYVDD